MNKKNLLRAAALMAMMAANCFAQNVPNYVPTNGLVGWWPFNGNANDESGNGNNGTVNGATLTSDRFGNSNGAYSFNGTSNFISVPDNNTLDLTNQFTLSTWINLPDYSVGPALQNASGNTDVTRTILGKPRTSAWNSGYVLSHYPTGQSTTLAGGAANMSCCPNIGVSGIGLPPLNTWINITVVYNGSTLSLYLNGALNNSTQGVFSLDNSSQPLLIGKEFVLVGDNWYRWFKGIIDDIAIWNRALTQQEITALYNPVNCASNTSITPQINYLTTSSTATFTATTSDPNPSYVWQSDFGQGFQTLNNVGNYSGVSTSTLSIANIQVANHNQAIRVITSSGNCIDTSNTATIQVGDTCIQTAFDTLTTNITVYDTVETNVMIYDTVTTYTTVTDTLLINTTITGLTPPNNANTIKVFPNPTNDHITIDYGNFALMNGYQLRIQNSLGQQVFQTNISQQSDYLSLNNWGGNGLYFVHLIDPQGNTIDIRKIVLQ